MRQIKTFIMKISSLAPFLLLKSILISEAQRSTDVIDVSFEVMRAANNLDSVVMEFQKESGNFQPSCGDPLDNYVSCISVEDDIDETTFLVHPLVPSGTKLKELAGTPDYDLGKGKVEAFIDAVSVRDCVESGNIGVATYPWLSETDSTSPVTAMSLVRDVMASADWGQGDPDSDMSTKYICGTGPLTEAAQELLGSSILDGSFSMVRSSSKIAMAEKNLDDAIQAIQLDMQDEAQPNCADPVRNYVTCITAPKDLDDATFVTHPLVPAGTALKDLMGTPDYDLGKGMIEALIDAITPEGCDEIGNVGLATFDWLDSNDVSTKIKATSFVKDFELEISEDRKLRSRKTAESQRYVCSTGPLTPSGTDDVSEILAATSDMVKAADNIENAITSFQALGNEEQPPCVDPLKNYVTCFDVQDDIDETTFIDHPVVPTGTTLGSLKGTPDYELGKSKINAFIDATSGCDEVGKFALADYEWLSADDIATPVLATSVVMDFKAPVGWWEKDVIAFDDDIEIGTYVCGSNPINESPLE